MSEMTPAQIADQDAAVRQGFAELLGPLESKGIVAHQHEFPAIAGNGCRVLATAKGVRTLVADRRILHLIETRNQ